MNVENDVSNLIKKSLKFVLLSFIKYFIKKHIYKFQLNWQFRRTIKIVIRKGEEIILWYFYYNLYTFYLA